MSAATGGGTHERGGDRRDFMLGVLLTATFMQLLDVSIVNVAIPSIQADLSASFATVELVVAAYLLAFAVVLITGGRLGDIYERRRLFLVGMAGFTVASAVSGAAPTATVLVVARLFQGLFSGLMFPQVLSVIQVTFEPRERGRVFGIFGAVIGLATILGPLLGGALIAANLADLSWRLIFYVNVPIGVAGFVGGLVLVPESTAPDAPRLDLPGVGLATFGLGLLIFPLVEGRQLGWPLWLVVLLAFSIPVLATFAAYERHRSDRGRDPLLRWSLFHQRSFVVGSGLSLVFFLGVAAFFFAFSVYLQVGLGFSALATGLTLVPFAVGSAIASYRSHTFAVRLGNRVLSVGTGLLVGAMALVILTIHLAGTELTGFELIPSLGLAGVGLGLVVAPVTNIVLGGIRPVDAGAASGALSTAQQVGGAVGVALIGIVFFGLLGANAGGASDAAAPALRAELAAAQVPAAAIASIEQGFAACFSAQITATDPTVVSPVCGRLANMAAAPDASPQLAQAIRAAVFDRAMPAAQREDFSRSIQETLLYEVAVFLVSFVVILGLPAPVPPTWGTASEQGRP